MEQFFNKHSIYIAVLLFAISVPVFANQVLAYGRPARVGAENQKFTRENNPGSNFAPQNETTGTATGEARPNSHASSFAKNRLSGGKLQSCQSIEKALTNRSTHLVDQVTKMEKTFTSIAEGVEQYYLTKVIPTGTTLSSYDSLVADISTKQAALTPLVTAAQNDVTNFTCTGDNPGALMTQYRTDMQAILQGLKDYRTSIKNLIVAVRTLPSISPSAAPSSAPSATPTSAIKPTDTVTPTMTVVPTATATPTP